MSLATTGSGHNIAIGGNVTATSGTINLNAAGGISETAGTLTATTVDLTSGTGSIGASGAGNAILTAASNLSVNSGANAYVSQRWFC